MCNCSTVLLAATFTTHPWVVRLASSKDVLGQYIGDTAVLEILPHLGCQVHPGTAKHIRPRSVPTPLHWGTYRLRCRIRGIAIMVRSHTDPSAVH